MSAKIEGRARELLEQPNCGSLATISAGGAPHLTVVWVDVDGDEVLVNGADGRVWVANIRRDPRVAIVVADPANPYEYVEVRGRLREWNTEGADAHIDSLAKKYLGQDTYPYRGNGEVRVMFRIEPDSVRHQKG
jgi:PPOX class probable F420-dependent enzyme